MSVLSIRTIPDDILRTVCDTVTAFDPSLASFVADMLDTMYAAPGRGLAAPQVGVAQRIFVMDPTWKSGDPTPQVFVNPKILDASAVMASLDEGCLSIPDVVVPVTRPAKVTLQWCDVDGAVQTATFDGFSAACIQHEVDHLDGILCTDYAA